MRGVAWVMVVAMAGVVGCAGRKSSLLLERQARGPLNQGQGVAAPAPVMLSPTSQTQSKQNVEVVVTHASPE